MSVQTPEEIIADLRAILRSHLREWSKPWVGAEFGKGIIGNALLGALEAHGCHRGDELRAALADVQAERASRH